MVMFTAVVQEFFMGVADTELNDARLPGLDAFADRVEDFAVVLAEDRRCDHVLCALAIERHRGAYCTELSYRFVMRGH
jgi:hypothetical protein